MTTDRYETKKVITEPNNNTNNNKKRKTLKISKNRNFSAIIQAKVCI